MFRGAYALRYLPHGCFTPPLRSILTKEDVPELADWLMSPMSKMMSVSMVLSSLYLIVTVAPLLCMLLVVNVEVLDVAEVFPIVLDVPDVASFCHLVMFCM